jgi:MFS family permease
MSISGGPRQRIKSIMVGFVAMGLCLVLLGALPNIPLIAIAAFGILLVVPVIQGCGQAILQSKVPAGVQGRVFAMLQALVTVATLIAIAISGPLADQVFNPMLAKTGVLAGSVGQWIGVGAGRGIGFIFILLGFFAVLAALIGYLSPRLRNVEKEIPDAPPVIPTLDDENNLAALHVG